MYTPRKFTILSVLPAVAGLTAAMAAQTSTAHAQDAEVTKAAPLESPPESMGPRLRGDASAFATMDRISDESAFVMTTGMTLLEGPGMGFRTDLFGQVMSSDGLGGFVSVPLSVLTADGDSATAIGNVEVGGVSRIRSSDALTILFRGGVMLSPGSNEEAVAGFVSGFGRLTDFVSNIPDTTTLRLSASPVIRQGSVFARADFGVDVPMSQGQGDGLAPLLRANVGVGAIDDGGLSVAAELTTLGLIEDDTEFVHTLGFTARYSGDKVQPGLSLVTPLDDGPRGHLFVVMADVVVPLGK